MKVDESFWIEIEVEEGEAGELTVVDGKMRLTVIWLNL